MMNLCSHSSEQPEMYCLYLKIELFPKGIGMDTKAKFSSENKTEQLPGPLIRNEQQPQILW